MFSGIIESIAIIKTINQSDDGAAFDIEFPFPESQVIIGASIAINGVCLTVTKKTSTPDVKSILSFDAINETLRKTNLGELLENSRVNFERSVTPTTRMDGHFVTGHIDDTAVLLDKREDGVSIQLRFQIATEWRAFIAQKGSITINGVSLTVGQVGDDYFEVYIIPHTAHVTNLGELKIGDRVNIEVDTVARYVVNYLSRVPVSGN
jgi:riboflavin synthase